MKPLISLLPHDPQSAVPVLACGRRRARRGTRSGGRQPHPARLLCRSERRAARGPRLPLRHARSVGRRIARMLGVRRFQALDLPCPELADEEGVHQSDVEGCHGFGRPRSSAGLTGNSTCMSRSATRSGPAWPTAPSARGATHWATSLSSLKTSAGLPHD